jgi:hypothetical protein
VALRKKKAPAHEELQIELQGKNISFCSIELTNFSAMIRGKSVYGKFRSLLLRRPPLLLRTKFTKLAGT